MRYYVDGYWFGLSNHEQGNDKVMFLPFPNDADSGNYAWTLDEPLDERIKWNESVEIFRLSLFRKTGPNSYEGWGERRFYLRFSQR